MIGLLVTLPPAEDDAEAKGWQWAGPFRVEYRLTRATVSGMGVKDVRMGAVQGGERSVSVRYMASARSYIHKWPPFVSPSSSSSSSSSTMN